MPYTMSYRILMQDALYFLLQGLSITNNLYKILYETNPYGGSTRRARLGKFHTRIASICLIFTPLHAEIKTCWFSQHPQLKTTLRVPSVHVACFDKLTVCIICICEHRAPCWWAVQRSCALKKNLYTSSLTADFIEYKKNRIDDKHNFAIAVVS